MTERPEGAPEPADPEPANADEGAQATAQGEALEEAATPEPLPDEGDVAGAASEPDDADLDTIESELETAEAEAEEFEDRAGVIEDDATEEAEELEAESLQPLGTGAATAAVIGATPRGAAIRHRGAPQATLQRAPTQSEIAVHVTDNASRIFVIATVVVFVAILLNGLLLGNGGLFTRPPEPTAVPSLSASPSVSASPEASPLPS